MPRLEYRAGSSAKFWEIRVEGASYTVTYGRIGTVGRTSTKTFADAATAANKAQSAMQGKIRKGYVEVGSEDVEEEQRDLAARLVDADRLEEAGDPRGALIALQHQIPSASGADRAALRKQEQAILAQHADALLGPLATDDAKASSKLEWKLGYWRRLTLFSDYDRQEVELAPLLESALRHPSAQHLEHLHLGIPESVWDGESSWQAMLDALARVGSPELKHLEIADYDDNAEISWCDIGDLSALWAVLPALERLTIRGGGIELGDVKCPTLQDIRIRSGGLPRSVVTSIGKASLPALARLEVLLGTPDYGADTTVEDCQALLSSKRLPALRHLGLMNGTIMDALAAALPGASIVRQLEVLDLSMGTMTDDGAASLTRGSSAFTHLKRLDVSDNFLRNAGSALKQAVPSAITTPQKNAHEYGDDEPWYYTSVAE